MHLHRGVGFNANVLICKIDLLASVGVDLEQFTKYVTLVILILNNLLLAPVHGGFRRVFNVLDSSQGSANGWREQYYR